MKIGYLGAGTWGSALTALLASQGHQVKVWDRNTDLIHHLNTTRTHPKLSGFKASENVTYCENIEDAIEDIDLLVESVTSSGIRPVLQKVHEIKKDKMCPIIITSKGIEQKTGLLFPEVALEVLGEENKHLIGIISGPSHAEEVIHQLPTSVVASSFDPELMKIIVKVFTSPDFRVYPNADIYGVAFGGAFKNIIAIACGISDGLGYGVNTKAALMTRGLHEMRKLCTAKKAIPETLNGLSGLGDLIVTCSSTLSRNYRFGRLIAEGLSLEEAKEKIGMIVEGVYTTVSGYELGKKYGIPIPITEAGYKVLYEGFPSSNAVKALLQRTIKEEHL